MVNFKEIMAALKKAEFVVRGIEEKYVNVEIVDNEGTFLGEKYTGVDPDWDGWIGIFKFEIYKQTDTGLKEVISTNDLDLFVKTAQNTGMALINGEPLPVIVRAALDDQKKVRLGPCISKKFEEKEYTLLKISETITSGHFGEDGEDGEGRFLEICGKDTLHTFYRITIGHKAVYEGKSAEAARRVYHALATDLPDCPV